MDALDNPKLKKLLFKLLDPEFKVQNDTYLNNLLEHIKKSQDKNCPRIKRSSFVEWLKQALQKWEIQNKVPSQNILAFTVNLCILISNEELFVKLNNINIYEKLISLIKKTITEIKISNDVKLSFIRLLSSFLSHKSGVHFVISTNYWSEVVDFVWNSDTIYIRKEGCNFIALLLQKSVDINELFCINVIQTLSSPLCQVVQQTATNAQNNYENFSISLFLLNQVFASLLELCGPKNDVKILKIILRKFAMEKQIRELQKKIKNEEIIFQLNKVLFTLAFFDFILNLGGRNQDIHLGEAKVASQKVFDVFLDSTNRGPVANFLKLIYVGVIYWQHIKPIMPSCKTPESIPVSFETQLVSLQLFPIVMVNMKYSGNYFFEEKDEPDNVKEEFMTQMTKYITPDTFRITFKWKSYLLQNFSLDHATLALKYVLQSRKFYLKDTAKTAFQIMIHTLHGIVEVFAKQPQHLVVFSNDNNYMCMLLETLKTIINDFSITWKDCFESVCVASTVFELLSYPVWTSKVVVNGLKLLEVAIAKYMAPHMALLLDCDNDSVLNIMRSLLYAKTHDGDWEVRDSALEIVKTYAHIAKKFPSLSKIMLKADLPSIVLKMSKGDMDPYVRATAYKCLQEMMEIDEMWENLLVNDEDLINYLIQSLHHETEGIVRKEIATLISVIYEFQQLSDYYLSKLYDIMSHAVLIDLYWEVKVMALDFWQKLLNRHLMDQGVIDGVFPQITFSKEEKKIITLNETEIRRRLVKVLNQLSQAGCLAVFIGALQDDCDLEVSRKACSITKKLVAMLKQYKITKDSMDTCFATSPKSVGRSTDYTSFTCSPQNSYASSNAYSTTESIDFQYNSSFTNSPNIQYDMDINQDAIIDEILDAQDLKLLESVINSSNEPVKNSVQIKPRSILNPGEFLNAISNDFEDETKEKAQWLQDIDNFNSLLDDMLKEYKPTEINTIDCY